MMLIRLLIWSIYCEVRKKTAVISSTYYYTSNVIRKMKLEEAPTKSLDPFVALCIVCVVVAMYMYFSLNCHSTPFISSGYSFRRRLS